MSWFHYVGSHVHNFCDTDNGYFLEGGKGEQLLPGREIRYRCECTVPSAGEYTLQFELDTRIRLRINEIPVDYSRGIRLKGFLPQTAWKFRPRAEIRWNSAWKILPDRHFPRSSVSV